MKSYFLLFFSLTVAGLNAPSRADAAACCGGGFAAPSVITGDDRAQMTASYAYSEIVNDVGSDSQWRKRNSNETSETLKIEAAHIFRDRWQVGAGIPIVKRTKAGEDSTGLGDVTGQVGYEYLPDWDYNPWRPKGVGYFQVTAPTGTDVNDSETRTQLDSRGRGFWALGAGTVLTKIVGKWDVLGSFDAHRSFAKKFSNSQANGTMKPGWGGNLTAGVGYNLKSWRFGSSLTWTYEDPIAIEGSVNSRGSATRYATAALAVSYLIKNEWAATLTYSDQTLFGNPVTTSLGRGVTLILQKRWLR